MPYTRFSILLVMSLAFSSFLVQLFVWVPGVKFFGSWEQVFSHVLATLVVSLILKFWLGNLTKLTLLLNCSGFWLLSNYCNYDLCPVVKMSFFLFFLICKKNFIVTSFWTSMQLAEISETEMPTIFFTHLALLSLYPPVQQLASLDLGVFLVNPLEKQTDFTWKVQEDVGKLK